MNFEFNWLLITDNKSKNEYPKNVKVMYKDFSSLKKYIQSKFDFNICLDTPYKLCDYKPAYGYIFEEYLYDYDFWGYCDLDLIFGDLSSFVHPEILDNYDKIGHLGHFCLYKNIYEINTLFMKNYNGILRYKEVFTTNNICIFDEWEYVSINDIFKKYNKKIYFDIKCADIYPYSSYFQIVENIPFARKVLVSKTNSLSIYKSGKIYMINFDFFNQEINEYSYIHLQKRNMKIKTNNDDYIIYPDSFINIDNNIIYIYLTRCILKKIINKKKVVSRYKTIRYKIIVVTHPMRKFIRKMILYKERKS